MGGVDLPVRFRDRHQAALSPKRENQSIFLDSKANWARVPKGKHFRKYPKEAIIDWHRKRGLLAA